MSKPDNTQAELRDRLIELDGELWDYQLDKLVPFIEQEIAKANDDITANQLLNHIAGGMRYDETFTFTELEEALEALKEHKDK